MIRISTIFIAICMVLVAASLGLALYSVAGISGTESAIVALTALTFLILYNAVSMRLRDRTDVGGFYVAIGNSDAWFSCEPSLAWLLTELVSAEEAGHDHDAKPLRMTLPLTHQSFDLGFLSRRRSAITSPVDLPYFG